MAELNRSLTGMGHERYASIAQASGATPGAELARRLFATGKVGGVHVYANVVTVDLLKGFQSDGLVDLVHVRQGVEIRAKAQAVLVDIRQHEAHMVDVLLGREHGLARQLDVLELGRLPLRAVRQADHHVGSRHRQRRRQEEVKAQKQKRDPAVMPRP